MKISQSHLPEINGTCGNLIDTILFQKGVGDPASFLKASLENVQPYIYLDNIFEAADSLIAHIKKKSNIGIIVDPDADGFFSTAVLTNYLNTTYSLDGQLIYFHHEGKVHGLDDIKVVEEIKNSEVNLLIIPDASGTRDQCFELNQLGIDIIILDHHDTDYKGHESTIVVNNQHSKNYKNKSLSGVGVVWQFCRAMDSINGGTNADNHLDIVAAGNIADVMDIRSIETQGIIKEGLKPENIVTPLLAQCLRSNSFKLGNTLNPTKVSFWIAPLINAVTRIGSLEEKKLLLESLFEGSDTKTVVSSGRSKETVSLAEEAYRVISNAKSRQGRRQDAFTQKIEDYIVNQGLGKDKILLIALTKDDFKDEYRPLAGLVCNRLQEIHQKPAMILFQGEDDIYQGSCRAPSNIEAFQGFKDQCLDSNLVELAAGHLAAFGLHVAGNRLNDFKNYFNNKYADVSVEAVHFCDYIFDANDPELAETIETLADFEDLWGPGLPEPLIAVKNIAATPSSLGLVGEQKGKPTLKISLPGEVGAIKFKSSREEYESLRLDADSQSHYNLDLVGRGGINEFSGRRTPQLLIKDYEVTGVDYDF